VFSLQSGASYVSIRPNNIETAKLFWRGEEANRRPRDHVKTVFRYFVGFLFEKRRMRKFAIILARPQNLCAAGRISRRLHK